MKRFLLALIFVAALIASARSRHGVSATDNIDLSRVFQIDLPPADTAILIDASLSMRNFHYADVRRSVIDFASTLTGKETLHLRIFGDVPSSPLEGPVDKLSGNIAEHLPTEPMFHHTDLGAAIGKSLEFFERPTAGEVQMLFLLTDGQHDPPAGSPYTRDFSNDPNWLALQKRALALCEQRRMMVYGFGLGSRTDVSLLLKIFPASNVEVVVGDASQLTVVLRRVRESLKSAQLRRAIEAELNHGAVEVRFAESSMMSNSKSLTQPVTIRNRYSHLPVVIDSVSLQNKARAEREIIFELENPPRNLTLEPGEQWQGNLTAKLQTQTSNWRLGRIEQSYRAGAQLQPLVHFLHAAEIESLGINQTKPTLDAPPLAIELRAGRGIPYWLIVVSSLAGICFVLLLRRGRRLRARQRAFVEQRRAERRRLSGALAIWPAHKTEADEVGIDLSFYKAAKLDLSIDANGLLEIIPLGSEATNNVAHLSGQLTGASDQPESGKVEFQLEVLPGHRLAYEAGGEWREAARVILCDRDLIEIDGSWRLRYSNHRLRTRAEVESASRVH